jgi:hypothetical protein
MLDQNEIKPKTALASFFYGPTIVNFSNKKEHGIP